MEGMEGFLSEAAYGSGQDGGDLGDIRILILIIPIMLNRL
jgi:hypothetical protein